MADAIVTTCLWLAAGLLVYHHFIYPLLLRRLAQQRRSRSAAAPPARPAREALPSVTIIIPARNEARVIAAKIENLASIDYPGDKLHVVLALDGCTDDTRGKAMAALARLDGKLDLEIVDYPTNIGKVAVLNDRILQARNEIVALSDASALVNRDALLIAASHFADPAIGVVCGTYRLAEAGSEGERAYWEYQTRIKADEAAIASPMGMHGAFYLFRRSLWTALPADTINDDFVLPMMMVADGNRAVYDTAIVATEIEKTKATQEVRRRVRIGAGNMQQTVRLRSLAHPRHGWLAFLFVSGKGMRPLIPFLVILVGLATAWLAARGRGPYRPMLLGELTVAGLAVFAIKQRSPAMPRPIAWLAYWSEGNWAALQGAVRYLTGQRVGRWQPAQEDEEPSNGSFVPPVVAASKRAIDVASALVMLAVLLVLLAPIALAIRRDTKGPIFYRQLRVGRSTPTTTYLFQLIKFRTMTANAEVATGPTWATKEDPRITRVGNFLRKTRLDELPQCINVLRGEMSIIGPRPERPSFFSRLEDAIPFYAERTYGLRPGITGLAQVNQAYDASIEDVRNKLMFDHAYAARLGSWTSWLVTDLTIMLKTIQVMALGKGQ
jgi:lipopolysaccharide/colanic/teichoic acid biosynthesis glycosyltransferase/glycosyltransferase involved in cell wall biosynthesis